MVKNVKKIVLWALVIGCMTVIFCFSHQEGSESKILSNGILYKIFAFFNLHTKRSTLEFFSYLIRKAAHFSIYALLGFLTYASIKVGHEAAAKKSLCFSFLICAGYAVSDEIHQFFVPGRSAQATDVVLDCAGALFGIGISLLICYLFVRRREHG